MSVFYTSVHRYGSKILYRGYKNGRQIQEKIPFAPTLYVPNNTDEETKWHALDGTSLKPMKFESINEAKEFAETYKEVSNFTIYGNTNYVSQFIAKRFPDNIDFDLNHIAIGNIDIEVESEDGFPEPDEARYPIQSIAYRNSKSSIYEVWGMGDYDPSKAEGIPEGRTVRYRKCNNENELLMLFIEYWTNNYPDVITGWNVRLFDVAYLVNRVTRVLGDEYVKKFSPWGIVNYRKISVKGKTLDTYEIYGIAQLDYMDIFQKFGFSYGKQESYALNHISHTVLGEKKLSYEEYGTLHNLHKENYQRFIDYNLRDVILVEMLEQQTGLLELTFIIAYKGGVNYPDTLGTTAIWESILYRFLNRQHIAIPPASHKHRPEYPGGYVKTPVPGRKEWVVSFDLNSLYPLSIVQCNMSPETIANPPYALPNDIFYYLDRKEIPAQVYSDNLAVAPNGVMFTKDKIGMLPAIIESYYAERALTKKKMIKVTQEYEKNKTLELKRDINILNNNQMAVKILMNSLYGALGNQYFRYFDIRIAEGITTFGQMAIMTAERAINAQMNKIMKTEDVDYVVYMDTDSLYVNFKPMIDNVKPADPVAFLDKACAQVFEGTFEKAYAELATYMNSYKNSMAMKREAIANAGIWTAKKRYILNVHNSEGVQYAEPKLKIMGIEAVKSSTPQVVRDKFKKAYRIMLDKDEASLQKFVSNFYDEFSSMDPEQVSFPRGVSDIEKWICPGPMLFKKGCPIHVRGAILYNHYTKLMGIRAEEIKNGSKVKFCYLKLPNTINSNIISFPTFLPKELGLHRYIDYDTQFNKTFKEPLELVSNPIQWSLEHVNTLDAFFS